MISFDMLPSEKATKLDDAYRTMAEDHEREAEASEWVDALTADAITAEIAE